MANSPIPARLQPPFTSQPIAQGGAFSHAWANYNQNVADRLSDIQQGVTDGSDAEAGQIGEVMAASSSGAVSLSSGASASVATLNLTPGDWDVSGLVSFSAGAGTHTSFGVGLDTIGIFNQSSFPTGAITQGIGIPPKRYNVSAATAVQLMAVATFTSGTVTAQGVASARRMR